MRTNFRKWCSRARDAGKVAIWSRAVCGRQHKRSRCRSGALIGIFSAALIVSGLCSWDAHAHRVNVFAYVEGDAVVVQGYFGGKAKAMNCAVEIYDSSDKKLAEAKTDSQGLCSFRIAELPPFEGGLKVILVAGSGHKAKYSLEAGDLPGKASARKPEAEKEKKSPAEQTVSTPETPPKAAGPTPVVDEKRIAGLVDEALDKRIGPIVKMLGNQQKLLLEQQDKGPRIAEIIGGIGWIFGLVGVGAYFMSRNGRKDS